MAGSSEDPAAARSAPFRGDNLLDRLTAPDTRRIHDRQVMLRERVLLSRHLGLAGGQVLSVGCGWNPGRHLFPAPQWRLTGVDSDAERVAGVLATGRAESAWVGQAGALAERLAGCRFDVVLYRLALHHIAYQRPLAPIFTEAASLLEPGGVLVAVEPGRWHPVGLTLAAANRTGWATALHGTPDDIPLSPRTLTGQARAAGLEPRLHAVTFTWRRLPGSLQRALQPLDRLGSRPRAALGGHTLMLLAKKPG